MDSARQVIRERMERREDIFLRILERNVYGYPASPYLRLLKLAGCELADVRALVRSKGLEGALTELRGAGVYVDFEEFKGRKPIVRGGVEFCAPAHAFDNPFARRDFVSESGGSTGPATQVNQDLDYNVDRATYELISLAAYGVLDAPLGTWGYILPGSGMRRLFQLDSFDRRLRRWFTPTGWRDSKYWFKYDLAMFYMLAWMRVFGMRVPFPKVVRPDQPAVIAQWLHRTLQTNDRCLLFAGVSRAMRVCVAAEQADLDLTGAAFRGGGEPVTAAKIAAMQRVGARYLPTYAMSEAGYVASGCVEPAAAGDVHLLRDAFALITHPHLVEGIGVTAPAINLTTLLPGVPKLMLNVQMDDYGIVEERHCGCEMESYGYTTHLREIYSYSKLVGEGVTLIGSEMLRILEQVLPARFGGTPLDYQLVEEEDARGYTRVCLIVSPRVQIDNDREVVDTVLRAMRESSSMADAARSVWKQTDTIRVRHAEPILSPRGKLLPLRIRSH
ncbi:MAG: hypothetical protein M1570_01285 [Chloroflexi bacterium]|nr:hypothetical protein [Chloroflexota bacterium]